MEDRKKAHWKVWGYSYTCSECGYCGAWGPEKYCANCGAEMSEPEESWCSPISHIEIPRRYTCGNCGAEFYGVKNYCHNCGKKFVKELNPETLKEEYVIQRIEGSIDETCL